MTRVLWLVGRLPTVLAGTVGQPAVSRGGWQDALLERIAVEPGIELSVAYPGPNPGERNHLGGVDFYCVGPIEPSGQLDRVLSRWSPNRLNTGILREIRRTVDASRPDVVHAHGAESGFGLAAAGSGVPLVVSVQGVLTVYQMVAPETTESASLKYAASVLRGISPWHARRRFAAAAATEKRIMGMCDVVAGRTEFDRRIAAILAPQADYVRVGEVLRQPFYDAAGSWVLSSSDGRPTICMTGGSYSRKGIDTALLAVAALRDAGTDVRLRIIGSGLESATGRAALLDAQTLRIEDRIVLLDETDAVGVVAELLGCDMYVHPSRADNSPNSLCEAMMVGVPCIASWVGGVSSLATDHLEALLVPPGDAYSLAGAMLDMLADSDVASELGRNARKRAAVRHNPDAVVAQLMDAYRAALSTKDSADGQPDLISTWSGAGDSR